VIDKNAQVDMWKCSLFLPKRMKKSEFIGKILEGKTSYLYS